MKTCGNVGNNTVFYSLGAKTADARLFRDRLVPKGSVFNDAVDQAYTDTVMMHGNGVYFHVTDTVRGTTGLNTGMNRQDIYVARYSEAMAKASSDTA